MLSARNIDPKHPECTVMVYLARTITNNKISHMNSILNITPWKLNIRLLLLIVYWFYHSTIRSRSELITLTKQWVHKNL